MFENLLDYTKEQIEKRKSADLPKTRLSSETIVNKKSLLLSSKTINEI